VRLFSFFGLSRGLPPPYSLLYSLSVSLINFRSSPCIVSSYLNVQRCLPSLKPASLFALPPAFFLYFVFLLQRRNFLLQNRVFRNNSRIVSNFPFPPISLSDSLFCASSLPRIVNTSFARTKMSLLVFRTGKVLGVPDLR